MIMKPMITNIKSAFVCLLVFTTSQKYGFSFKNETLTQRLHWSSVQGKERMHNTL
jgi:hypothetical protein